MEGRYGFRWLLGLITAGLTKRFVAAICGALVMAFGAVLFAAWKGANVAAQAFFSGQVLEWTRPEFARRDSVDSAIIQDNRRQDSALARGAEAMDRLTRVVEASIAAQRQADPKYDTALRSMVANREAARRREKENRALLEAISTRRNGE